MFISHPINFVRWLLVSELVAIFVSTSLAVGVEFLIYLTFIVSPVLWLRLKSLWDQPMVRGSLAWGVVLLVAGLYCVGGSVTALDNLGSWRKLLLLPLAAAVSNEEVIKNRIIYALILTATLGVLLSYFSRVTGTILYHYPVGISIHNHATQGMVFAVSVFAIAILLRMRPPEKKWYRVFLVVSAIATFLNLIFITDGRSGYLVMLILTAVAAWTLLSGYLRYVLAIGLPIVVALMLSFSPVARGRIHKGISETKNYQQAEQLTSMGIRMAMWKNTVGFIAKRPIFGHGSGGFSEAYRRQVEGQAGWQGQAVDDPHNQFLRIMAEQGVLGLLIFLLFIGSFFRQLVPGVYRILGLGVVLAWCGTSMFSGHFSTFAEGRFIYLWCGALLMPQIKQGDE